jgi:pilus assembly protein CpaB
LFAVLGVALLFGLMASIATFRVLRGRQASGAGGSAATIAVVVARQDLTPGTSINRLNLDTAPWPREHVPPQSFEQVDDVVGRQVSGKIFRGEPIVASRLLAQGEAGGLNFRIPDGMLAMSLKVSPEIGVSGFIQPGNRVDVITTVKVQRREPMTKLVLQNILVLAVGHEIDEKDDKPEEAPTVTLAVTPEQAEKLAASKSEGSIVLALRNVKDQRLYETPGFTTADLVKIRPARRTTESAAKEPADDEAESIEDRAAATLAKAKARASKRRGAAAEQAVAPVAEQKVKVVELIQAGTRSEVKFSTP